MWHVRFQSKIIVPRERVHLASFDQAYRRLSRSDTKRCKLMPSTLGSTLPLDSKINWDSSVRIQPHPVPNDLSHDNLAPSHHHLHRPTSHSTISSSDPRPQVFSSECKRLCLACFRHVNRRAICATSGNCRSVRVLTPGPS